MAKTRRHGSELETAIYQATLELLKENGFANLSFGRIAERAQTSKSVVYRRWDSPFELVIAAVQSRIIAENNGRLDQLVLNGNSLNEDLKQLLERLILSFNSFEVLSIGNLLGEVSKEENNVLQTIIKDATLIDKNSINNVVLRAQHRGELGPGDLPEMLQLLPFEWMRYRIFLGKEIRQSEVRKLINLILLPSYKSALPMTIGK